MTGLKASEEHDLMFLKYHYGICVEIRQQWRKSANSEKGAAVTGGNDAGTDGNQLCKCREVCQRAIKQHLEQTRMPNKLGAWGC